MSYLVIVLTYVAYYPSYLGCIRRMGWPSDCWPSDCWPTDSNIINVSLSYEKMYLLYVALDKSVP